MGHADRIWPALACLRRGELPSPAEVDALFALARGECEAPKQPRLLDVDGADPLEAEWRAAFEVECLAPCPPLSKVERNALARAARMVPRSERLYGYFFRWRVDPKSPDFAQKARPTPEGFLKHLPRISSWAGPRIAAAERAAREREEVERAGQRPAEAEGTCAPPPGGFAALVSSLVASKTVQPAVEWFASCPNFKRLGPFPSRENALEQTSVLTGIDGMPSIRVWSEPVLEEAEREARGKRARRERLAAAKAWKGGE